MLMIDIFEKIGLDAMDAVKWLLKTSAVYK